MSFNFRITGRQEIHNQLAKFCKDVDKITDSVFREVATEIKEYAVESMKEGNGIPAPPGEPPHKQTHNLANSIKVRKVKDGYQVYTMVPYGKTLEYGESGHYAHPWLRPAFEACTRDTKLEIIKHVNDIIRRS